ncbi:MAG: hypothetical protein ACREBO_07100, partial [Novosphingobium sp.]
MKIQLNPALGAALLLALSAQPALAAKKKEEAAAPAATGAPLVPGLAVASLDWVAGNSDAKRAADTQRPVTYKPQIDVLQVKRAQIAAQLKPLYDKIERDSKLPNANQAALQQQAETIQRIEQGAQQELNRLAQPLAYSEAYVGEQIDEKIGEAVKAAMTKGKVSILLNPQAINALNNQAYNLNQGILTELNVLLPTAQLVPPQGWEPRQIREARAAQAAQAAGGAAPSAVPVAPAPAGTV